MLCKTYRKMHFIFLRYYLQKMQLKASSNWALLPSPFFESTEGAFLHTWVRNYIRVHVKGGWGGGVPGTVCTVCGCQGEKPQRSTLSFNPFTLFSFTSHWHEGSVLLQYRHSNKVNEMKVNVSWGFWWRLNKICSSFSNWLHQIYRATLCSVPLIKHRAL